MSSGNKSRPKKSQSESEENACPVCFKHVDIYSIGVCDHAICFECSTRMRVLCKQMECPICRQELVKVAFVKSVTPFHHLAFNSYLMDKTAKIYFENPTIQESFTKLLIHSCAVCSSKATFPNLQALKDHLRKEHEMFFCDLCVDNLKIFTWERRAYTRTELAAHRRKGDPDNTSHRGHPLCNFCDQRYVDGDELFRHLRRDHYFCHFCDADGLNQYYCAYEDLRDHFREAHFLCEEGECKEEKFTRVFRTDIDFRAHRAQTHSQSLGKAAAKQARTLELEFTLAPRATNEPKGRNQQQRRGGGRNREREEPAENVPEPSAPRFAGPAATIAADIRNTEEFPSLSGGQAGTSAAQGRTNAPDSLARKLAKGNRFTVRNSNGTGDSDEEFPSLSSEPNHGGASKQPEAVSKSAGNGAKRSVHVRVGRSADQESTNGSKRTGNSTPNVSIQVTQKYPAGVGQGAGPPPPQQKQQQPPVARVTRVSSSQNIQVQPSRGLQLDSEFPSLVPSTAGPSSSTGSGWVKKEQPKPSKPVVKTAPKDSRPTSAEDFPTLAPSSSKSPLETPGWKATKAKPVVVNGGKVAAVNGTKPTATSNQPAVEMWAEPSKGRGKNKKKNPGRPNSGDDDTTTFASEAERKISEMQIGELRQLSTFMGGTKLDLTSVASTAEPKTMNSKIGLIKQSVDAKPADSGGAKPKAKLKPSALKSEAEFPSLGPAVASVPSFFEKKNSYPSSPPPPPPGFAVETVTPTKVTFTSSSGQSFPLSTEPSVSKRTFTQPPDFALRNQQLISTVADLLCNQQSKINQFRTVSSQFRHEQLEPSKYYYSCMDIMGEDCFMALFPELVCLLPDIEKQQQLLKVHRSELRMKGGASSAEPYVVCATCSQVLSPSDLKHHIASHSLETNFPVLGPSTDANSAWNKR